MENDDTKNGGNEAPEELSPSAANINADNKTKNPKAPNKKAGQRAKGKKWSLWRHWKQANAKTRMKWAAEFIVILTGVALVGNAVWSNLESIWNFKAEHRPKVIFSRPPELVGGFACTVRDKAIHARAGMMHMWVRNIRKGDAVGAFVIPQFSMVPEKKVGDPYYDDPPPITDETCKRQSPEPLTKAFPVPAGQEVEEDMIQFAWMQGLYKTADKSVRLSGNLNDEPSIAPGNNPRVPIAEDAIFDLYAPVCIYYFDEAGKRYASCRSYRLVVKGQESSGNPYGFSCSASPVSGTLRPVFFGYCEN